MLRPPAIPTALSMMNSLLCMRWLTRPKSDKKLHIRQRRFCHRVEEADLDIGVGVERRHSSVRLFRLDSVSSSNRRTRTPRSAARIRPVGHDPTGGVDIPDVILRIQGLFGQVGHGQARRERATSLPHQAEPGLPRMPVRRFLKERADGGGLRLGEGRRGGARVVPVDSGAAPAQQEDQSESRDQALEQANL